jgi:RNA polymerase sigma-70 factor, ECF subfamily
LNNLRGPYPKAVTEGVPKMASVGRIDGDPVGCDEILAAARRGEPAARWDALAACRAYLRLVVGKNCSVRGDGGPDTSDLVQNTILEGWRGFSRFEGRTPGQLRAWLRVILIHSLIKTRRRPREARLGSGSGANPVVAAVTPPSVFVERESSNEAIAAACRKLPEHYQKAIRLRLWDELSFAEIGSTLEISEDSARKLYGRAIVRLRELLGPDHDPR